MLAGFILHLRRRRESSTSPTGSPLLPLQILWINFAVDVLLASSDWASTHPPPGLACIDGLGLPMTPSSRRVLGARLGIRPAC